MTRFPSPWDAGLKLSTLVLLAVLAAVGGSVPALVARDAPALLGPLLLLPVGLALLAICCWALSPRGFAVEAGQVRVLRPLWPVTIPLSSIRAAVVLPAGALRGSLRLGGGSGLFGTFGYFWSRSLGAYRMYVTSTRRLVLLDTAAGRFLLSPDPPARFAALVRERAPGAASVAGPPPRGAVPRGLRAAWVAIGVAVLLAVTLPFLLSWAYAPRAATLEGDALRIERNGAGPVEIPLASVRGVRWVRREDLAGWHRTSGVALGRMRYGSWASPALGRFRLYAWGDGPLLLLETDEGHLLISADGPLAEALRARLAR